MIWGGHESSVCIAPKDYPTTLISQWKQTFPEVGLSFATVNQYLDVLMPLVRGGQQNLPEMKGGWTYTHQGFWINCPKYKQYFRRTEHALQASEMLAAAVSLRVDKYAYPSRELYQDWVALLIAGGRNGLWSCCVKSVVEDDVAWDQRDRFDYVLNDAAKASQAGLEALLGRGDRIGLFNPANWPRQDVLKLRLPEGKQLKGVPCQPAEDGQTLCRVALPSCGTKVFDLEPAAEAIKQIPLPAKIETEFYTAVVDPKYGDLVSLKLTNGKELLGGPANVIVADQNYLKGAQNNAQQEGVAPRPKRAVMMVSRTYPAELRVTDGPVALTVEAVSDFIPGGKLRRTMRFLKHSPRIDCATELNDIPPITTVLADFPLADGISEVRRGIPYGFSHGGWGADCAEGFGQGAGRYHAGDSLVGLHAGRRRWPGLAGSGPGGAGDGGQWRLSQDSGMGGTGSE